MRVIEDGKVRTVVEALFGWHNSKLYQRYILPKNDTHMDVEIGVYWNENDTVLKLMIPSAMEQGTYYGQVMFGREALAQEGQEVVAQRWNAWTDGEKTFTAVNGGSYGSSIEDGVIGLTLLHSAGYSAADFDEKRRCMRFATPFGWNRENVSLHSALKQERQIFWTMWTALHRLTMKSLMCSPSMHPEPEKRKHPQFWSIRQMFWSLHGKRQKTGKDIRFVFMRAPVKIPQQL